MQYQGIPFIKMLKKALVFMIVLSVCSFVLSGCGKKEPAPAPAPAAAAPVAEDLAERDSLTARDTAVLISWNQAERKIRLQTAANGKSYEAFYDELTEFSDRYGKATVPELFEPGMITEVLLSVHSKTLVSLRQSPDSFILRDVQKYSINKNRGIFRMGDDNLRITEKTAVFKNGAKIRLDDINEGDSLTLRGMEPDIYSIVIDSGNGHLRLTGTEYFLGGWVQVGKDLIRPVTEDMILDVPEGEYDVVITYHGRGGSMHVNIERGKEALLDVSGLKGELVKYGRLAFTILPTEAKPTVRIDGEVIDHLIPIELEYGVYRLEVEAEGYEPVRERIGVGQEMASIEIELQEAKEKAPASGNAAKSTSSSKKTSLPGEAGPEEKAVEALKDYFGRSTSSSAPASQSSSAGTETGKPAESGVLPSSSGLLYIDAPEGAEVYFDGSYKGIVPCSFKKSMGTHVITLRKDGYHTKTYTLTLDNTTENETYSFTDLMEE